MKRPAGNTERVAPAAEHREAFLAELSVSRETTRRLDGFVDLLLQWTPRINLVSRGSIPDLWRRHVADSAQLLAYSPPTARRWLDLGSGGGFPGMILAVIAAEQRPALRFGLVESDARKAVFLQHAAQALDIAVDVHRARAEILAPQSVDVVSARALAPMIDLLALVARHVDDAGVALLPKGANVEVELTAARERWHMETDVVPSRIDPSGVVVIARGIRRAARD